MPGANGKKKSVVRLEVKEDEMSFVCEWDECSAKFHRMQEFLHHLGAHIAQYTPSVEDHGNCFSCGWRECGSQILGNIHDFHRHVYFHAFHVKLKCIGEVLFRKGKFPECSIGRQSRNWIPELPENLQCGWTQCGAVCDNPVIFYCHVNQHCEEYPIGHKPKLKEGCVCHWTDCRAQFKTKYKLMEHLRTHTQEKIVACPTCGGLFANRTKYFDHLTRQKVSSVYCYQCSHCNKRFATERLLRDHMRHHVNHYKCPYCDMTCPAPSSLRAHFKYRHTLEKPFKCAHCDHCAKSASDLRRHMECHSSDSLFRCSVNKCDYVTRNYSCLSHHYRKEHQMSGPARYACHLCELKVTRGSQLTKHLKKKHKFRWPPGHSRFRYKMHEDGMFRLQTIRYESIDVTEQIMEDDTTSDQEMTQDEAVDVDMENQEDVENTDPSPETPLNLSRGPGPEEQSATQSSDSLHSMPSMDTGTLPKKGHSLKGSKQSEKKSKSTSHHPKTKDSSLSCFSGQSKDTNCEVSRSNSQISTNYTNDTSTSVSSEFSMSRSQTVLSMPSSSSFTSMDSNIVSDSTFSQTISSIDASTKGSSINFTLISNPEAGETSVQNLCVGQDGILVFDQNNSAKSQDSPDVTDNKPFVLTHDSDAYNLEMLGHVALLGQNLPTPKS